MIWLHNDTYSPDDRGVYYLRNIDSGKIYIGMTTRSFQVRWIEHAETLEAGTHHNRQMQADYARGERFVCGILVALQTSERIEAAERILIEHYTGKLDLYNVLGVILPFDYYKDGSKGYDTSKARATTVDR